jgi:hypothetical protein
MAWCTPQYTVLEGRCIEMDATKTKKQDHQSSAVTAVGTAQKHTYPESQ